MIKEAIAKIVTKQDLTYDEAYGVMMEIMKGETTPTQNAAFLAALSTKSTKAETIDEIAGCAAAMRDNALKVDTDLDLLEIVGTGGDNAGSINISTTSALIIAAAGIKVAKHGNRAASSKCGAADCLEALGVNIDLAPEKCVELGFRTVFNIRGPLTNPAHPKTQLLGVYDESLCEPLAKVLMSLGVKRGMVVFGQDKLDEISISAPTTVCEFKGDMYKNYEIRPEDFGFMTADKSELVGGTPAENAAITLAILNGEEKGAKLNAVLMNAGAAIYLGGKADTLADGVKLAQKLVESGVALKKLNEFIEASNS